MFISYLYKIRKVCHYREELEIFQFKISVLRATSFNCDIPLSGRCFKEDSASSATSFFIVHSVGWSSGNSIRKPVDGPVFTVAEILYGRRSLSFHRSQDTRFFAHTLVPHPLFAANYTPSGRGSETTVAHENTRTLIETFYEYIMYHSSELF